MSYTFENPFAYFNNPANSNPVGLGRLYIGLPELDPSLPANQVQVYVVQSCGCDDELAVSQPIVLSAGGVPMYNGSPVQLKIAAQAVSVKVTTITGAHVYYTPVWYAGVTTQDLKNLTVPSIKQLQPVAGLQQYAESYVSGSGFGGGGWIYDTSMPWSAHNGGTIIALGAVNAWNGTQGDLATILNFSAVGTGCYVRPNVDSNVTPQMFGAFNGLSVDSTLPIQKFVNYIQDNQITARNLSGEFLISSKVNFKASPGWGLSGCGPMQFRIIQNTDNVPVLDLGVIASSNMFAYELSNISLGYANVQPSTNTNANPIKFSVMGFQGILNNIRFERGSWAIRVASGIGGPWGQNWDNLVFTSGLTGGAMDWTGAVNAVPNNVWGRFLVECRNMVGPVFKQIKGYNFTVNNIELLDATNVQWIDAQAGLDCDLRAIKLELADYYGTPSFTGNALIYTPNSSISIGSIFIGGTFAKLLTSNTLNLINCTNGYSKVDFLNTQLTEAPSATTFLCTALGGSTEINYNKRGSYPITNYTNVASATAANFVIIYPDKNDKLSENKGDADYSFTATDPCNIVFSTALTAQRVVNIPSGNTLFNGFKLRIASRGAVNGANTILVKSAGFTKYELTQDNSWVDLSWRRVGTAHQGWVVTGSGVF